MNVHSEPFVPRRLVQNPTIMPYQPLGHTSGQPIVDHIDDASWTPLWSDMFKIAQQERERRELQEYERAEDYRQYVNRYVCQQRNLIHVRPQRQIYCNVSKIEEYGKQLLLSDATFLARDSAASQT